MSSYVYVDNSNVWIEGRHIAAVKAGLAASLDEAQEKNISAPWSYDFGKLLSFAGGEAEKIKRAVLFGSRPPKNDSLWNSAKEKGFEVVVEDRDYYTNREKKIDMGVGTAILEDSYECVDAKNDEVILVSGDKDYLPIIRSLKNRGIMVIVCFWSHAAREIKDAADKFYNLDDYYDYLKA